MNPSTPSALARRERTFVEQTRARLKQQRWLRLHVSLIALLTLAGLMGTGLLLRLAGIESLALRYAMALPLAYLIYLGLLRLWAGYLLSNEDAGPDAADALDLLPDLPLPRGGGSSAPLPRFEAGGGGDFGGGGATASFADAGEGAGEIGAKALDGADEGAVVIVPLLVVLAIGALMMTMLGLGVFALFGVDVLMAVVLEVALAGLAGGFAWRRRREGWLRHAFSHTWKAALAMLLCGVLLGATLDHWVPQAQSLPHALKLLRGG
jgi:hypothetical protein